MMLPKKKDRVKPGSVAFLRGVDKEGIWANWLYIQSCGDLCKNLVKPIWASLICIYSWYPEFWQSKGLQKKGQKKKWGGCGAEKKIKEKIRKSLHRLGRQLGGYLCHHGLQVLQVLTHGGST